MKTTAVMFLVRSQPGGEVTLCLLVTIASPTVLEMTNSAEGGSQTMLMYQRAKFACDQCNA